MKKITLEQFQLNFDYYIDQAESGDSYLISSSRGTVVLMPYEMNQKTAEELEYLRNHNDAC